ncbi:cell division protein FtsY [Anopheles sinensis]|uniref:Cell division protein FtsY n=1 Tax=Anopheles sinensis TaxID=74873 RepID=A0A084W1G3_ANOSI|nr:cell division protein FtsY [Anopheles sinensis]
MATRNRKARLRAGLAKAGQDIKSTITGIFVQLRHDPRSDAGLRKCAVIRNGLAGCRPGRRQSCDESRFICRAAHSPAGTSSSSVYATRTHVPCQCARVKKPASVANFFKVRPNDVSTDDAEGNYFLVVWLYRWKNGKVRFGPRERRASSEPCALGATRLGDHTARGPKTLTKLHGASFGSLFPTMFLLQAPIDRWPSFGHPCPSTRFPSGDENGSHDGTTTPAKGGNQLEFGNLLKNFHTAV